MQKYALLTLLTLAIPAFGQDALFPDPAAQMAATWQAQNAATLATQMQQSLAMQQSAQGDPGTCDPGRLSLSAPRFSIKPGPYSAPQYVKISHLNRSATIYYTTDGSIPTQLSPKFTVRHRAIPILSTTRLQAVAIACEGHSPVASALFTLPAQTPPLAPQAPSRSAPQKPGF